jgi:hypothetical protein
MQVRFFPTVGQMATVLFPLVGGIAMVFFPKVSAGYQPGAAPTASSELPPSFSPLGPRLRFRLTQRAATAMVSRDCRG